MGWWVQSGLRVSFGRPQTCANMCVCGLAGGGAESASCTKGGGHSPQSLYCWCLHRHHDGHCPSAQRKGRPFTPSLPIDTTAYYRIFPILRLRQPPPGCHPVAPHSPHDLDGQQNFCTRVCLQQGSHRNTSSVTAPCNVIAQPVELVVTSCGMSRHCESLYNEAVGLLFFLPAASPYQRCRLQHLFAYKAQCMQSKEIRHCSYLLAARI